MVLLCYFLCSGRSLLRGLKGNPIIFCADVMSAILLRATGQNLQAAYAQRLKSLELHALSKNSEILSSGDIAALVYLWNPFTIVACVGLSTSPVENLVVLSSLYGACKRMPALAAFGWVVATHLSLYPAILIIPLIFLLGYGPDAPPRKLFIHSRCSKCGDNPLSNTSCQQEELNQSKLPVTFSWKPVIQFLLWISFWSVYVLILCGISVKQNGGLSEMFKSTYGFILTVEDLSPNMGVLWYFFAEVFEFFRNFFLIVFHVNILFMVLPLAISLNHRPCFLAFVYIAISSMLKSYPSVGDSALYLALLGWFVFELADMQFSFLLFCGYVGVSLLSPVMHNLWIWRGTGNANFYYATAMAFACFQIVLVVEGVSAIRRHDRTLRKLSVTKS
ncbi:phosphatidylinositol glycan anchor biosynthesis class U protein-like isoform X2 [Mangifera indica]|uniref:phosphatidylinositol glycan anchor biosynthesis class U protein-like isoform X2 n=1 Tax=Mangifera indica TaxID=29780 RepID=UPI001CFA0450|nr:phosphatidylinositol glycan anchor biosynthesis class U protein-like isoform X2 [Mangifera indica]